MFDESRRRVKMVGHPPWLRFAANNSVIHRSRVATEIMSSGRGPGGAGEEASIGSRMRQNDELPEAVR